MSGSSPLTRQGWETYQQLHYRRHSSQDHMTTQTPPLRQSRGTYLLYFMEISVSILGQEVSYSDKFFRGYSQVFQVVYGLIL
jgi:hypothetical protein